ncbi:MAG: hypothetical protein AAGI38_22215 [Bacteroidota bacterium]
MGEFIAGIIFEIVGQVIFTLVGYLLGYPGAALRWFISRTWKSQKSFQAFVDDGNLLNGLVFILACGLLIFGLYQLGNLKVFS